MSRSRSRSHPWWTTASVGLASPVSWDVARVRADSSPYERANMRHVPLKMAWILDKNAVKRGSSVPFRTAEREGKAMDGHQNLGIEGAMHYAKCVAQVMEAVAIGHEGGKESTIRLGLAVSSIPELHECHFDAALIVITKMLNDVGCDSERWRLQIPVYTAAIVASDLQ